MSKYTPGPYEKVESDIIGEYLIYPPMATGHIAEVHGDNTDANADLFVAAPETAAERDKLEKENAELKESLQFFVTALETGLLVRDITKDSQPDWALKMMGFVKQLQKVQAILAEKD